MHISTAINHQERFIHRLKDIWSAAEIYGQNHDEIILERKKLIWSTPEFQRLPRWTQSYIRRYDSALYDATWCYKLVFSYEINGKRLNIDSQEYRDTVDYQTLDTSTGAHVWRKNGKIFSSRANIPMEKTDNE